MPDVKLKSMQNNLIFYNIDENEEENCPELIINFCDERLKIGNAATKISITDAFRLGKKSDKTRPILVKFASFENRDFVKKNAKNLKGSSYGISEQLPAEIMKSQIAHFEGTARSRRQGLFRERQKFVSVVKSTPHRVYTENNLRN